MNNPWLNIPSSDYVGHMTQVGQAQLLNRLTKESLSKYKPEHFVLLGCATGNGLEHVDNAITKKVYAIDINADYLKECKSRFKNEILGLEILNLDVQEDGLPFTDIDLFFIGLVLEYVDEKKVLEKILKTLRTQAKLLLIIQKTKQTSFVSKSQYKSLEQLAALSKEINEDELIAFLLQNKLDLISKTEIPLNKNKSFIHLEFQKS